MKIHFLTAVLSDATGGITYDTVFFNKLVKHFDSDEVRAILDKDFEDECKEEKVNYKRFDKIYRNHADEILNCDYLFINSREYTRMVHFPWRKIKKHGCKVITIHHHFNFLTESGFRSLAHRFLEMRFLQYMDLVLTPNIYVVEKMKNYLPRKRTYLLESYIETAVEYDADSKRKQIAFVGNIISRKGVDYAIEAFAEFHKVFPEYIFKIVGKYEEEDTYYQQLTRLVKENNLVDCVEFMGRLSELEKNKVLSESELFLFPSLNEGYGWVIIEAMRRGVPVIAFNNTAMPYTVNESNGRIVENRSVKGLTEALIEVVSNRPLYESLCNGAINTVKMLPTKEDLDEKYCTFFQSIGETV